MKKAAVSTVLAIAVAAMVSSTALAAPPAGPGTGMRGPGQYYAQVNPEQVKAFQAARAKFMNETLELRKAMAVKRVEMQTLWAQTTPDEAKIKDLKDQMIDLRAQIAKKRNAIMPASGPGFGRGMRGGFGGKHGGFGPGMHGGFGPGMGGYGPAGYRGAAQ